MKIRTVFLPVPRNSQRPSRPRLSIVPTCLPVLLALMSGPLPAAQPPGDLTGPWQLIADDYLIASRSGVARVYHPFKKHPANPVLVTDQPWEHDVVSCSAVLPDESGSGYRMWYHCWTTTDDPDHGHALYATSPDGIVSLEGGDKPGEIVTKRLKGLSGKLHLNCEAAAGLLQVEVLDAQDRVLPGYGKKDCNEPRGDGIDQVVTWHDHAELPANPAENAN